MCPSSLKFPPFSRGCGSHGFFWHRTHSLHLIACRECERVFFFGCQTCCAMFPGPVLQSWWGGASLDVGSGRSSRCLSHLLPPLPAPSVTGRPPPPTPPQGCRGTWGSRRPCSSGRTSTRPSPPSGADPPGAPRDPSPPTVPPIRIAVSMLPVIHPKLDPSGSKGFTRNAPPGGGRIHSRFYGTASLLSCTFHCVVWCHRIAHRKA